MEYKSDYECYQQLVDQVANHAMEVGIITALHKTMYCDASVLTVRETLDLAQVPREDYEKDCEKVYYSYVKMGKTMEEMRLEGTLRTLAQGEKKQLLTQADKELIYIYIINKELITSDVQQMDALKAIHRKVFPL